MRNDKTLLAPTTEKKEDGNQLTEAEKLAREEIKRARKKTQSFKKEYFDYYDDVKINSREDW